MGRGSSDDSTPGTGEQLLSLSQIAMQLGIKSLLEVFAPVQSFVITEGPEGRGGKRPADGPLEQQVAFGRWLLSQDTTSFRAAQVWDGYITMDGERTDAVFVAAHERGARASTLTAQRYRLARTIRGKRPRLIGDPVPAGDYEPLLPDTTADNDTDPPQQPPPAAPWSDPSGFVPPQ